jgi:SAM-dependent methyltransferase
MGRRRRPATLVHMASAVLEQQTTWFASWFDSFHYHKLYAHRDDAEAAAFVDALVTRLGPAAGSAMLDLGCGAGRHARQLAARGFDVTGVDLSAGSIQQAKAFERAFADRRLRFVRRDMREPFGDEAFDYVFSFFTSFGYFDSPAEHLAVVDNIARSLKPGGTLVLDYLNVAYAEAHLTKAEVKRIDDVVYRITRWTDASHFFKRIVIDDGRGAPLEYVERVAKFRVEDFREMFARHGLWIDEAYGDYRWIPYDATTSPRLILVATKLDQDEDDFRERFLRMRLTVSGVTPRYDASIHCGTRCAIDGYVSTNSR